MPVEVFCQRMKRHIQLIYQCQILLVDGWVDVELFGYDNVVRLKLGQVDATWLGSLLVVSLSPTELLSPA